MDVRLLGPGDAVKRRPFTSPDLLADDYAVLSYILEDLRGVFKSSATGSRIEAHQPIEWSVHGLKRRVIACDLAALRSARREICVVGFFGERHVDRDSTPLEEANADLVLEFRNYPGILSYSSMELVDGNWANLVLHDRPEAREDWRASQRHADAATRLSPLFYRTVRIHNGVLPRGVAGNGRIIIQRTKYWDFRGARVWQAVRELGVTAAAGA
jgi:hypothetical protein